MRLWERKDRENAVKTAILDAVGKDLNLLWDSVNAAHTRINKTAEKVDAPRPTIDEKDLCAFCVSLMANPPSPASASRLVLTTRGGGGESTDVSVSHGFVQNGIFESVTTWATRLDLTLHNALDRYSFQVVASTTVGGSRVCLGHVDTAIRPGRR